LLRFQSWVSLRVLNFSEVIRCLLHGTGKLKDSSVGKREILGLRQIGLLLLAPVDKSEQILACFFFGAYLYLLPFVGHAQLPDLEH
jgi:hypothetical protein